MTEGPKLTRAMIERPLPKRFYKRVEVNEKLGIELDGRSVKTPLKVELRLPTRALAEGVAQEWDAQDRFIDPSRMPLTRLSNTAIDRVPAERAAIESEIVAFAGSDLILYRAENPDGLVKLQQEAWDPVLEWANSLLGVQFRATQGIIHRSQDARALETVQQHIKPLDHFTAAALHEMMVLTGSALLAMMHVAGALPPHQAWDAAHVDEDFQISQWGSDSEAEDRRQKRKADFEAAARFLVLLKVADR
jgi:chaperone required for assembly of F1-ATPase